MNRDYLFAVTDGRHPDEARTVGVFYDTSPEDRLHECETCGEIEAAPGEPECALCVEAAAMAYRSEHDSGAER